MYVPEWLIVTVVPLTVALSPSTVIELPLRWMYVISAAGSVEVEVVTVDVVVAGADVVVVVLPSITDSGSLSIRLRSFFWMERASLFVIPSPRLKTSPLFLPSAVICWLSEPSAPYFEGFDKDCMIITASEISTFPSQLASP